MIFAGQVPGVLLGPRWKFFRFALHLTERFAGFVANAYLESGWNLNMDIHGVVDDWMQQERPLG